ncbi:MAG: hypothetical protein ACLVJ8_05215 [Ruthenibacterium lactatiformans]
MREHFSPELLGRLDEVLVFGPLAQEDLVAIGERCCGSWKRAPRSRASAWHTRRRPRLLVREAYEPSSGAHTRRAITRRVEQCLAQQLLGGVENGAAADFLLDAPQDVLSLARRCGTLQTQRRAACGAEGSGRARTKRGGPGPGHGTGVQFVKCGKCGNGKAEGQRPSAFGCILRPA